MFFIAISLGNYIPIRSFFYKYVPLFDIFRFPALFRLFFMFSFLIIAGYSFEHLYTRITKKQVFTFLFLIIGMYCSIALFTLFVHTRNPFPEYTKWHSFIFTLDKVHAVSIQACILSCIYICGFIFFIKYKKAFSSKIFAKLILCIICADMLSATLLQKPITVTSPFNAFTPQHIINTLPKSIHDWDIHENALSQYDHSLQIAKPLWRNNQIFFTKRTFDGYTSFIYTHTEQLYRSPYFDTIARYPLFYTPQQIILETDTTYTYTSQKFAIIPDSLSFLQKKAGTTELTFLSGTNNYFSISAHADDSVLLVFMQNRYPGWNAYVNTHKVDIIPVNYSCMGIILPQGISEVTFSYEPKQIIIFHYMFQYSLYALLILCVVIWVRTQKMHTHFLQFHLKKQNHPL